MRGVSSKFPAGALNSNANLCLPEMSHRARSLCERDERERGAAVSVDTLADGEFWKCNSTKGNKKVMADLGGCSRAS